MIEIHILDQRALLLNVSDVGCLDPVHGWAFFEGVLVLTALIRVMSINH